MQQLGVIIIMKWLYLHIPKYFFSLMYNNFDKIDRIFNLFIR